MSALTHKRNRRHRAGFTLVELIVASTLLTMVLTGVYTTFSISIRMWRSGESNYETYEDARRAFGILSRELRAIPPEALHLMTGTVNTLEFVTLSEPMNVEEDRLKRLMWVSYSVVSDMRGDSAMLQREEAVVEGPLPVAVAEGDRGSMQKLQLGRSYKFTIARNVEDLYLYYQWALPQPHPPQLPPYPPLMVGDTRIESGLPENIQFSLSLHDPGVESLRSTFTDYVTFRGETSPAPQYLIPVRGD